MQSIISLSEGQYNSPQANITEAHFLSECASRSSLFCYSVRVDSFFEFIKPAVEVVESSVQIVKAGHHIAELA